MRICWQAWQRSGNLQTAQRDTLALSFRLRRDFAASRPESLAVQRGSDTVLLSFLSYESVQGTETMWNENGEVLWRKWNQYFYEPAKHSVRRREVPLATPSSEPTEPAPAWDADETSLVAGHVSQFQVSSRTGDIKLKVTIVTQDDTATSSTQVSVLPNLYALDTVGY
ncbi:MAG: hypothetical protein KF760_18515 [Candidatus Eremiobacteraeota bacterium]|nr:hypothetical protein [Candidatus Eremiobacteraeota bacterium]MCW5867353.1 hypothetical protein [Candidatus Eremiobacteraeota bacterium]